MFVKDLTHYQVQGRPGSGSKGINKIRKLQFSYLEPVKTQQVPEKVDFLKEIDVELNVELGQTQLTLREVLNLKQGSLLTLDKTVGDTVDLKVNKVPLASGEVLVINEV
ncbi:MAG: FliM/FliN family flagellar motor switch protein, partial [Syntrophomonadaceae bacterium]|nr:FliM/FliN family flagellar motor switch protein [Syntrophomonadaceae bacterium]